MICSLEGKAYFSRRPKVIDAESGVKGRARPVDIPVGQRQEAVIALLKQQ
jgi:hypothetical protein